MSHRVSKSKKAIADRRERDVELRQATAAPMNAHFYRNVLPWQSQYKIRRWLAAHYGETFGALVDDGRNRR